jgi:hypothetical protein
MEKIVIFSFKGDPLCFMHVLLNAADMNEKGMDVKIVIEGESVKIIKEMEESANTLYLKVKEKGLIDCICKACSAKMGVLEFNSGVGIPIVGDMNGHPSMSSYISKGYTVITL